MRADGAASPQSHVSERPSPCFRTNRQSPQAAAAQSDGIADTIDYYAVTQRLLKLGEGREWKLIEKLAADIAGLILAEFKPLAVTVEVKKFIIPEARYVAVKLT